MANKAALVLGPDGRPQQVQAGDTLVAPNLTGVNTGDQDLSAYATLAGNTFSGTQAIASTDAGTNNTVTLTSVNRASSGTPAVGFGVQHLVYLKSNNTSNRDAATDIIEWATATDASRKVRRRFNVYDTAAREALRLEASGSAAMIGFLGASAVVRQTGDAGTGLVTLGLMSGTPTFGIANLTGLGSVSAQIPDANLVVGDSVYAYDLSSGLAARFGINGILGLAYPFQARLSLTSNTPIPAADAVGVSLLNLIPFNGKKIALYSSSWLTIDLSEMGIILSGLTSSRPHDVYVFYSAASVSSTNTTTEVLTFSGATGWGTGSMVIPATTGGGLTAGTTYFYRALTSTTGSLHTSLGGAVANTSIVNLTASIVSTLYGVSLELTAWTNDTTRATAITTQDGVYVKNGDATRRLVGTIFATSTSTTEDSLRNRYVANIYNAVPRRIFFCPGYTNNGLNTSYTDSTSTFKEANGSGNGNCGFITPLVGFQSSINMSAIVITSASAGANAGIGFDGITDIRAMGQTNSVNYLQTFACFSGYAGVTPGKHAWYLCTYSQIGTATWFADGANSVGGGSADYPDTYLEGWMMG